MAHHELFRIKIETIWVVFITMEKNSVPVSVCVWGVCGVCGVCVCVCVTTGAVSNMKWLHEGVFQQLAESFIGHFWHSVGAP